MKIKLNMVGYQVELVKDLSSKIGYEFIDYLGSAYDKDYRDRIMKITIELTDKQAGDLKDIMQTTYDRGSHDFPYQSEKMRELSDMICEAIDNENTKDINDTHG